MHISESIRLCFQRKKRIKTGTHMHVHVSRCATVDYMCECVWCYYFTHPSTVSACLSVHVHPCVLMLVCTMLRCYPSKQAFHFRSNSWHIHSYGHTLTHIQHFHSSTALCKQPRGTHALTEGLKDRQKRLPAGPTTGCCANTTTCIEEKQRVRQRQLSGIIRNIYTHTHMYACFVCTIVWGARANQRHTRHHRSSRACEWSLHVRTCACWQLSCMLIKVHKQKDRYVHPH